MTIKNTNRNISAENANVITNVTFNDATGVLTFSQKNFYTGATTSFTRDLSGVQLGVVTLNNQAALETLETDSTKEDYKKTHLFLVPLSNGETDNIYEEYVYVETSSNTWEFEKIGSTVLDLSNYIQKSQTSGLIKNDGTVDTNSYSTTSHTHGNISNDGKVGSTSGKPLITTTNGAITTGSFGTSSGTFCEGNDSRLSDARTPTTHTHTKSQITDFPTIPSASSSTPSADVSGGAIGSSSNYAKADHQHPLSSAYATSEHNHTGTYAPVSHTQNLSTINNVTTVAVLVTYTDNTTETINLVKYTGS